MPDTPRQITALVIPPGGEPAYLTRITPDLDTLTALAQGYLQALAITPDSLMYLNEDGKYQGLPVNGHVNKMVFLADIGLDPTDFIVGQVVITGVVNDEGRNDGADHDVPESVLDLCARAGVPVEDHRTGT